MTIPFINLAAQHHSIADEIQAALSDATLSFQYCRGKQVKAFEDEFRKATKANECISTGNGTDALFIILKNVGIKNGDEVIVPAFTWISASETVTLCGACPVFADVDSLSYTLNPSSVEDKITSKTKAIIAVHLYGQAAPVEELKKICKKNKLILIEDCAQAHLAEENGQPLGTIGKAGAFSFYPTKNLGAYGDAGCIITNDVILAEKMRRFSNHGALEKDDHAMEGMNSRMDTIQAALLLAKLPHLKKWNEQRIANANLYSDLLNDVKEIITPYVRPNAKHTFHIYAISAKKRNELQTFLYAQGIQTFIHYPKALPNLPAYQYLNHKPEDFPVASKLQDDVLSLPIYPELKPEEITYICQKIKHFYRKYS